MEENTANENSANEEGSSSLEYEFATTTTLHGIGRVAESRGVRGKLTWVLVLLVTGGIYVCVTVDRMQAYLKFEANTKVDINFFETLAFPAVTICNYNRFMKSKISERQKKFMDYLDQLNTIVTHYDDPNEINSEYEDVNHINGDEIVDYFNYSDFAFTTGFSLSESMLSCSWKGAASSCDSSNFSSYYSPTYGKCYTFNGIGQDLEQSQQGIGNGLKLIVDIQQAEYTETFASGNTEAGLKFAIHPPDETPLLDTEGLSAAPGYHTYASMRLIRHKNLGCPWGACDKDKDTKYNRNNCLRDCRRKAIIEDCQCQPLGDGWAEKENLPLCESYQFKCLQMSIRKDRRLSSEDCDCPINCDYKTYQTALSAAMYPSYSTQDEVLQYFYEVKSAPPNETYDIYYARENLVYLDVYFNELREITYEQIEAIPFTALLGDLGGQLGLFLGASVITAVELVDYIFRRLKILILKVMQRNNVQPFQG